MPFDLHPDDTCGSPVIGDNNIVGMEWSDESCALAHGPVTGYRAWCTYRRLTQWVFHILTHLPLDKMAAILADDIFGRSFVNGKFCILIKNSLKLVPKVPIDNNPALVWMMAWRRIGDKPLSEPVLTRFTDAYMRHYEEKS